MMLSYYTIINPYPKSTDEPKTSRPQQIIQRYPSRGIRIHSSSCARSTTPSRTCKREYTNQKGNLRRVYHRSEETFERSSSKQSRRSVLYPLDGRYGYRSGAGRRPFDNTRSCFEICRAQDVQLFALHASELASRVRSCP